MHLRIQKDMSERVLEVASGRFPGKISGEILGRTLDGALGGSN